MIVIATNNGKSHLRATVAALAKFGTGRHEVLILDTGSTCAESLRVLEEVGAKSWPFNLEVSRTPYQAYDTGAYVHAYRNWQAESYLFMQDSIRPKCEGWVEAFEEKATYGVGCVPWLIFPMQWNCQEQIDFLIDKTGSQDWPPHGIFGPIFYATRTALETLDQRGFLDVLPSSKTEQMAMERVWPTAFALSGYALRPVEAVFDERTLRGDGYRHMTKQFAFRA